MESHNIVSQNRLDEPLSLRQIALTLAATGFHVVPVHHPKADRSCSCRTGATCNSPGKHPHLKDWYAKATTDAATIERLWNQLPRANIGIVPFRSGLIVLDVDPRNGGNETWAKLIQELGPLDAPRVLTGGGGVHYYIDAGGAHIPKGTLGPGIDVQGDRSFVVGPGSLHKSGALYEWDRTSQQQTPSLPQTWLRAMLDTKSAQPKPTGFDHASVTDESTVFGRKTINDVLRYAQRAPLNDRDFFTCPNPEHEDRNPSCHVDPASNGRGAKCFSCGWTGGVAKVVITLGFAENAADAANWLETHEDEEKEFKEARRRQTRNGVAPESNEGEGSSAQRNVASGDAASTDANDSAPRRRDYEDGCVGRYEAVAHTGYSSVLRPSRRVRATRSGAH